LQERFPPKKPRVEHVFPFKSGVSQSSSPLWSPFPQNPHWEVLNVQLGLHVSVPVPIGKSDAQLAPPRSAPSHCSGGSTFPSGHVGGAVQPLVS
jgi:hypothetical protein